MSLSSAGIGASEGLAQVLERRLREAMRQAQERQAAQQLALQREQLAGVQADREANRTAQMRTLDLNDLKFRAAQEQDATDRHVGLDAANVLGMPGMSKEDQARELQSSVLRNPNSAATPGMLKVIEGLTRVPPKQTLHSVTVPGPNGRPMAKGVTDDELSAGVETYREPKAPPADANDQIFVMRDGKPIPIRKGSAQPGDTPYDPTAQRNKPSDVPTEYQAERAQRTKDAVETLKKKVGYGTTGVGSLMSIIPGSAATDFAAELDTLKSSIVQNELAQMRAASKTGGALGQVSDRENQLLAASLGALDPRQSPKNISEQLTKIWNSIDRWQNAHKIGNVTPAPSHGGDVDAEIAAIRARRKPQ